MDLKVGDTVVVKQIIPAKDGEGYLPFLGQRGVVEEIYGDLPYPIIVNISSDRHKRKKAFKSEELERVVDFNIGDEVIVRRLICHSKYDLEHCLKRELYKQVGKKGEIVHIMTAPPDIYYNLVVQLEHNRHVFQREELEFSEEELEKVG